jgi:Zn finger protein HypA/HybF involved in hydrogenase expression
MHELGLAERIRDVALARAVAAGASRITEVELTVGDASDVDLDSITTHWPMVIAGTIAEPARLWVTTVPGPGGPRVVAIEADLPGAGAGAG